MACDNLLTTSLLQVFNRIVARVVDCSNPTGLLKVVSTRGINRSVNDKLQQA